MHGKSPPPLALPPDGYVRVGGFARFARLLRELGGRPEALLASFKLSEAALQDSERLIPLVVRGELIAAAVRQTGCEHFGLLLGRQAEAADLGLPGRIFLAAATVGEAFAGLADYFHWHSRDSIVTVGRSDHRARLGYLAVDGNFPGFQELQDVCLATGLSLLRQALAPEWTPTAVSLLRRPPRQPEIHERFFGAPCRFNAERSELIFPAATLDLPLRRPAATPAADDPPPAGRARSDADWLHLVRRTTLRLLLADNCSQRAVARVLNISTRTMNRIVERSGSSYREVVDFCRYRASRTLIKETDMSLRHVAEALGYADHSSFCRAFKRWSGMSPTDWRRQRAARLALPPGA